MEEIKKIQANELGGPNNQDTSGSGSSSEPTVGDVGELFQILKQETEKIAKEIQEIKRAAIRPVETPQPEKVEELQLMTPSDHINNAYNSIVERFTKYKNPEPIKDYELALYVLKNKGWDNEKIARFMLRPQYHG